MRNPFFLAIVAGLLFGCWPLLMNRSGLAPSLSAGVFAGICFATVLPFAWRGHFASAQGANWYLAVTAGVVAGVALLIFNRMLASVTPVEVGSLFIITLVVQVVVPAVYQVVITGDFSVKRILGFMLAVLAVFLLK